MTKIKYFRERRLDIERRTFSYSFHIPERRSGQDQRKKRIEMKYKLFHENSIIDRTAA